MNGHNYLIYVACGSAAASANLVKSRLAEYLKKDGVNANIVVMRVSEVPQIVKGKIPNLIIITAGSIGSIRREIPQKVPVMSGLPVMTMVGISNFIEEVEKALRSGREGL